MSKYTAEQVETELAERFHGLDALDMLLAFAAMLRELESAEPSDAAVKRAAKAYIKSGNKPTVGTFHDAIRAALIAGAYQPQEKGATHCDNCGLTWLDDGLNPIGCPYCKDRSAKTSVPKGSLQELLTTQIDGIQPDFRIAVQGDGKGGFTHIIIHPFDHDGDTLDFWVRGDRLYRSNDPAWEDLAESGGLLEAQPRPPAPAADCDAKDALDPADVEVEAWPSKPEHGMLTGKIPAGAKLRHKPTGIVVIYDRERSQHANLAIARRCIAAAIAAKDETE